MVINKVVCVYAICILCYKNINFMNYLKTKGYTIIMCIISAKVHNVANTKLLVAVNLQTKRQYVVYSNVVDNATTNNAMILPVPNPGSVKFHNLSAYAHIFEDCDKSFIKQVSKSIYNTKSVLKNTLKVFDVGSYKVSIANSLEDIKRINTNVFSLSPGCESLLQKNYSNSLYGFIICKLDKGNKQYHPFGYSHNLPNDEKVFIPTKHYHPHESNDYVGFGFGGNGYSLYEDKKPIKEEWDHDIYLINVSPNFHNLLAPRGVLYDWNKEFYVNSSLADFDFGDVYQAGRHRVFGHLDNIDLILKPYYKRL
jgi:hypothetical protein